MELLHEVWIHALSDFEPETAAKVAILFERKATSFKSADKEEKLMEDIGLSGEFSQRFSESEFLKKAKGIIEYCKSNGIRIITKDSEEYPESLREINLPPRLLFLKGAQLKAKDDVKVSVVGCRKPTDHGKSFARLISREMAKSGITVVSGMAEGIDGQAHLGALDEGGKTIAVLAGSVDEVYPRCHDRLYRQILENGGTIISERPPGTVTQKYFYRQRNRIIIGLSKGAVIVEGKEQSGTSITANLALEENRDVFAVPGSPMLWQSELPNRMISEGAIVVNNAKTISEYYSEAVPEVIFERKEDLKKVPLGKNASTDDERILEYLRDNGGISGIEELSEALNMGLSVLTGRLTILCIKGKLRQEAGNRYVLTE